nr:hypothetical protein FA04_17765 [Ensifer adhaerens]
MRMGIDETWHNDAASCIDGFSRHDFSACGSLSDFDTGDPSLPDIHGSPLVKRLAVAGDETSISDYQIHDSCSFSTARMLS